MKTLALCLNIPELQASYLDPEACVKFPGTGYLPYLARMAKEIRNVAYFKIETPGAASKLRELIRLGGDAIEGPWDGEEAITLLPDDSGFLYDSEAARKAETFPLHRVTCQGR